MQKRSNSFSCTVSLSEVSAGREERREGEQEKGSDLARQETRRPVPHQPLRNAPPLAPRLRHQQPLRVVIRLPRPDLIRGLGFRVWGLGFGVEGLGLRVEGLGFRVQGLGFRV